MACKTKSLLPSWRHSQTLWATTCMSTSVLISSQQASPLQGEGWGGFFHTPDTPVQHFCSSFSLSYFLVFPHRMKIVYSHVTGALVVAGSSLWWPTDFILFVPFPGPPGPFSIVFCQQTEAFIQSRPDTCRACRPWFLVYIILLCRKQQELQVDRNGRRDWRKHAHTRTHTHVVFVP